MYDCGWDGGGSKTAVCITDERGNILAEKTFGALNPNGTATQTVEETVFACVDFMRTLSGSLQDYEGLVIGTAGISNPSVADTIKTAVQKAGYAGKMHLTGDTEIALAGAIDGAGAVLIAGTGSVCVGRNEKGDIFRCGGWGHLIDDVGSGYDIGKHILIAVMRSLDGRAPATRLTEAVFRELNVTDLHGLIAWLYGDKTDKRQIASLAPLLLPALQNGDTAAKQIAEKAAQDLASLAVALWKKAELQTGELALTGSIFTHFDTVREQTQTVLQSTLPQIHITHPKHSPACGAARMVKEIFNCETQSASR